MNFYNLANEFMVWGKLIKPEHYESFRAYFSAMLKRDRVMVIQSSAGIECVLCYFITDELDSFINRPSWSHPVDNPDGHIFFVDKMVSRHWTPTLRRIVQREVEIRFPNVDRAFWLREPHNRSVIIKRRGTYELQN